MVLPDLKQLKAILKLCRNQGVDKLTIGDMAIEFGEMPYEIKGGERVAVESDEPTLPSDEELAFYSVTPPGMPEDPLAERMGKQ